MELIVVESPTKAKTLNKFLGKNFKVEATFGHIKDLPKSQLGVDVENNFKPDYLLVERQKKNVNKLIKVAKSAKKIYLATDPDREGEAISAHVQEIFIEEKVKAPMTRISFHEITKSAVQEAISHPEKVNKDLVNAQIARRVLDRLMGYKTSPLLWKKVRRGLSAGRVQSVAVRLIVEREKEIAKFKPEEYWEIASEYKTEKELETFIAALSKIKGKKAIVKNKDEATQIEKELKAEKHIVKSVVKKEVRKHAYPPFTTSTMTQAAAILFGWGSKKTMTIAQKLYEQGLITYHRTDSVNLSTQAINMAREYVEKTFGKEYLPETPNFYKTKSKSAQEAHEAIRVTNVKHTKTDLPEKSSPEMRKLYELVWKRFLASQMAKSVYDQTTIVVTSGDYELRSSGQIMKFAGWRQVMPLNKEVEPELPLLQEGQILDLYKVLKEQKFTQPPARYNEASLIKTLEQLGIGRPSTYAPVISTILARSYVEKNEKKFFATHVGVAVTDFLVENFPGTFDYDFTALMEDNLDKVAEGKLKWQDDLAKFYKPFEKKVKEVEKTAKRVKIETEKLGEKCPDCGELEKGELVIRVGRFGKFISCSRFPDCKYTAKYIEKIDMDCPDCGSGQVIVKKTAKGRIFYGCSRYPDCEYASWKNPLKKEKEEE